MKLTPLTFQPLPVAFKGAFNQTWQLLLSVVSLVFRIPLQHRVGLRRYAPYPTYELPLL